MQDAFRKLDVDDKGYLDEATVIKATQASERQPYDTVRQALKEVDLDSSRRVELDDYVDVSTTLYLAPWDLELTTKQVDRESAVGLTSVDSPYDCWPEPRRKSGEQ